jgi:hypothetical protein
MGLRVLDSAAVNFRVQEKFMVVVSRIYYILHFDITWMQLKPAGARFSGCCHVHLTSSLHVFLISR